MVTEAIAFYIGGVIASATLLTWTLIIAWYAGIQVAYPMTLGALWLLFTVLLWPLSIPWVALQLAYGDVTVNGRVNI